jgi:hypothetical protein
MSEFRPMLKIYMGFYATVFATHTPERLKKHSSHTPVYMRDGIEAPLGVFTYYQTAKNGWNT